MNNPASRSGSRTASFRYAFHGVGYVLKTQANARIHAAATLGVLALGLWLRVGRLEWAVLGLAVGLVWASEFMNTAFEAVIDLASPQVHPLAKAGKDAAAAGVLLAAGSAAVAGLLVLGPPLWARLSGG
jgi:diacylglycerol kinase (ATP)